MDYKNTYEKFWQKSKNVKFSDYVRNSVLHLFFLENGNGLKVCDMAGGNGVVAEWLQNKNYEVTLFEFSDLAIAEAKNKHIRTIVQGKIEGLNSTLFLDNSFDIVFFGDIIEHLFDPESALREMYRILKSDGKLIISCPNVAYWRFRTYYLLDGDFQRIDVARQKPWEQEHIRFFNIKILKEFLGNMGFSFEKYVGVNNIWHSKFLTRYFPNFFAHTLVAEFKKIK